MVKYFEEILGCLLCLNKSKYFGISSDQAGQVLLSGREEHASPCPPLSCVLRAVHMALSSQDAPGERAALHCSCGHGWQSAPLSLSMGFSRGLWIPGARVSLLLCQDWTRWWFRAGRVTSPSPAIPRPVLTRTKDQLCQHHVVSPTFHPHRLGKLCVLFVGENCILPLRSWEGGSRV